MANPYLEMEIRTASPEVLVGRLLGRAVQSIAAAIDAIEHTPAACLQSTARAVDIVSELRGALDMEAGGEIARGLDALYEFSTQRLLLGNATADAATTKTVLTFDWSSVQDPDGDDVTYTLEIASDMAFSSASLVLVLEELQSSGAIVDDSTPIPDVSLLY